MSNDLQAQIYQNLSSKETDDLLKIWQAADTSQWEPEVFEIVKRILVERLGSVPPQSIAAQVRQILGQAKVHLDNQELDQALGECESAIQLDANSALAYFYRGEIYDALGQLEHARADYQKAAQLDPELDDARDYLLSIDAQIKEQAENQVWQILAKVEAHLDNQELDQALSECELAIQLDPNSAVAYNYRGEIYIEKEQIEIAIVDFRKAVELDPELAGAWENFLSVESELEELFQESPAKQHLDQALDFAYNGEPQKALEECETAKSSIPSLAIASNYLGLILQTLNQLEPAMDSYQKAIELNPRFYAARENLASASVAWEEEQYRLFSRPANGEAPETPLEIDETQIHESEEVLPQWHYMDESAFILVGWAGHRTRQGRTGYDPLEQDFEFARIQGTIVRALLVGKFRTRNPLYLVFMSVVGAWLFLFGILPFALGNFGGVVMGILYSPYTIVGALLLANVFRSLLFEEVNENEDNGSAFF